MQNLRIVINQLYVARRRAEDSTNDIMNNALFWYSELGEAWHTTTLLTTKEHIRRPELAFCLSL